jgi:hypothetical protein
MDPLAATHRRYSALLSLIRSGEQTALAAIIAQAKQDQIVTLLLRAQKEGVDLPLAVFYQLLKSDTLGVLVLAAQALGEIGERESVHFLRLALSEKSSWKTDTVKVVIEDAMENIQARLQHTGQGGLTITEEGSSPEGELSLQKKKKGQLAMANKMKMPR